MDETARLSVELPDDLAETVRARVASGEYASESDVIREGLELLAERDAPVEEWLRTGVAAAYDEWKDAKVEGLAVHDVAEQWLRTTVSARVRALDEGRSSTKTADEVRASLAARANARDRAE